MRSDSLHLAGVKAVGDALILEIMRFEEEPVDLGELSLPSDTNVPVVDLIARLQESLEMARKEKAGRPTRSPERSRAPLQSRPPRRKTA